ncbi:MAG: endonuclease III [Bacteroidota bacterium]
MTKKKRYQTFVEYFSHHMPDATTELKYNTSFELLVAVILSAQCTDKRINQITPPLFRDFPSPKAMADQTPAILFPYIKSVSYPYSKATYLVNMARILTEKWNGIIPASRKLLEQLPGVGRKTANVILSVVYEQPAMPVDTHVIRVSKRLGLVSNQALTPLSIEKELVKNLPTQYIIRAHHWLILHGRYVCLARKPRCASCPLKSWCLYYETMNTNA